MASLTTDIELVAIPRDTTFKTDHEQPQLPMPFANVSSESLVPEETLHVAEQEDAPPNGGYGWVCCASVFMINAHTWGINSVSTIPQVVMPTSAHYVPGIWRLPSVLLEHQHFPICNTPTIRLHWWAVHLAGSDRLSTHDLH